MGRGASVVRIVGANRDLRRVELAFAGFNAAEHAAWIAMVVYAFGRGGTTEAGIVAMAQLLPAALFAPVAAAIAERSSAVRVLALGYLAQAGAMVAVGVSLVAGGPPLLSYALAALAATAVTTTRPAQAVIAPALARRPDELTAVNAVSSWVESGAMLVAPALTGLLLAVGSPGTVFLAFGALMLGSAAIVAALDPAHAPGWRHDDEPRGLLTGAHREVAAGLRVLREEREVRLLVLLLGAQYVVWGALDVLAVTLSIDVLGLGEGGAGYLFAAFGAGMLLGALASVALVGRRRLVPALSGGALAWGVSYAVLGLSPSVASAFALLAIAGAGHTLLDVAGRTLLQRICPTDVLCRVFGIVEALTMGALALGSIAVPVLVAAGGVRLAFVAMGAVLPGLVLVRAGALTRLDAHATVPVVQLSLLRRMRLFAALPPPAIEGLARSLEPIDVAADEVVVRQGDPGDRFYAIADGELEVARDGRPVATLTRGDGFGEIALLDEVPRTATVTARTPAHLFSLEKEPFVIALTGHDAAHREARLLVERRRGDPPGPDGPGRREGADRAAGADHPDRPDHP